jgi:hypothetical protein
MRTRHIQLVIISAKCPEEWGPTLGSGGLMSTHAEKHWKQIDTAPVGVGLRLIVDDHSGHHLLPYECKFTATGWINTATGHPLAVRPTHWQLHHVETLPSKRAWARRAASNRR